MEELRDKLQENTTLILAVIVVGGVLFTGFIATSFASNIGTTESLGSAGSPAYSDTSLTTESQGLSMDRSADAAAPGPNRGTDSAQERKRIERIDLDFEAPDVNSAVDSAKAEAESLGGYSESESFNRRYGETADVTLRVPKENVSEFLEEMENQGSWKLQSKDRNVDDVTDRYNELKIELRNKEQELNRLEELINQTNETSSLIEIQERMGELRSRIQYLNQELEDIDSQVEYTRVDIRFEEPEPITSEFDLRESVRDAYRGIFQSLNLLIVGTGYLLPVGALYLLYRGVKHWRGREN